MQQVGSRILIEPLSNNNQTKSGILIAHMAQIEKNEAIVHVVGPKVKHIKPGDKVRLHNAIEPGTPVIEFDNKNCHSIFQSNVNLIL